MRGLAACVPARTAFARRLPELAQLVLVIGGVAVAGELLLPTAGVVGFVERLAALAVIPLLLIVTRFFGPEERARMRALVRRLAPAPSA